MLTRFVFRTSVVLASLVVAAALPAAQAIVIPEDQAALEFVGQFNNVGAASQQFGYLSRIQGLSTVFSDMPANETTAMFTFVTNATNVRVVNNGPIRIVNRVGTTTIYLNTTPADFNNPASFSSGTPIQVSDYTQQVILNTLTGAFTTVHMNKITSAQIFLLNGARVRLGKVSESFRTNYAGQVNGPGLSPSGWFAGYAVGVDAEQE